MSDRYPYMPVGRTIKYVPESNPFMLEAMDIRNNLSTDLNHPTGAVLVLGEKIIGRAANTSALKNKKLVQLHKDGWCVRKLLKIPSGQKYWLCPGCASSRNHAETSAVIDAQKKGNSTKGSDLYLCGHWWCCEPCWNSMIKAGVRDVYLLDTADQSFKK